MPRRLMDPVGCFRFVLELGFLEVAGFSECTGLQVETSVFEYAEGGRNSHMLRFPERGSAGNVTLKRGIILRPGADALFKWHRDVMQGTFSQNDNPHRRPADASSDIDRQVAIVLQNELGIEVRRWSLRRPLPVKWIGPDLKSSSSEVAMETLELACEGVELG